jgi:hypothetical protein
MRNRYTIANLRIDLDRYHVQALYVRGHLGTTSVPLDMLDDIIMDGFSHAYQVTPSSTSPWLFSPLSRTGIAILTPNPGGMRNRNGSRGSVRIPSTITGPEIEAPMVEVLEVLSISEKIQRDKRIEKEYADHLALQARVVMARQTALLNKPSEAFK